MSSALSSISGPPSGCWRAENPGYFGTGALGGLWGERAPPTWIGPRAAGALTGISADSIQVVVGGNGKKLHEIVVEGHALEQLAGLLGAAGGEQLVADRAPNL